jgi:hypothetical protein
MISGSLWSNYPEQDMNAFVMKFPWPNNNPGTPQTARITFTKDGLAQFVKNLEGGLDGLEKCRQLCGMVPEAVQRIAAGERDWTDLRIWRIMLKNAGTIKDWNGVVLHTVKKDADLYQGWEKGPVMEAVRTAVAKVTPKIPQ